MRNNVEDPGGEKISGLTGMQAGVDIQPGPLPELARIRDNDVSPQPAGINISFYSKTLGNQLITLAYLETRPAALTDEGSRNSKIRSNNSGLESMLRLYFGST